MKRGRVLFSIIFLQLMLLVVNCAFSNTEIKGRNEKLQSLYSSQPLILQSEFEVEVSPEMLYDEISEGNVQKVNKILPLVKDINVFVRKHDDDYIIYSPLGIACKLGRVEIVKLLLEVPEIDLFLGCTDEIYEYDAIYVSLDNNNDSIFHMLIDKGVEINGIYNESGVTLLTLAVRERNTAIVHYLLEKSNLSPNGVGDLGGDYSLLPLNIAVENNDLEMIKVLIKFGADPSIVDNQGDSPIKLARELKFFEVEEFLHEASADPIEYK